MRTLRTISLRERRKRFLQSLSRYVTKGNYFILTLYFREFLKLRIKIESSFPTSGKIGRDPEGCR